MTKYFPLEQYCIKTRLYPTKDQAKTIDNIIHMIHVYSNDVQHDMKENGLYLKEVKSEDGSICHYPDWTNAMGCGMKSKDFYNRYIEADERLKIVPKAAFSSMSHSVINDMQKALQMTGNHPVEQWGQKYTDKKGHKITKGIKYYTKAHPRTSFRCQIPCSAIYRTKTNNNTNKNEEPEYKNNIFFVTIPKVGRVKVRCEIKNISFDPDGKVDFFEYVKNNPKKQMSCTIKRDTDNKYYLTLGFANKKEKGKLSPPPIAWKKVNIPDERKQYEGIDVGEINIAVLSDGTMYQNIFDKFPQMQKDKDTLAHYDKMLSNMWGYKNEKFRKALKEAHKNNEKLFPSNQYLKIQNKRAKLYKKIMKQRTDYYEKLSLEITTNTNVLGVESLSVTDMFYKKSDKENSETDKPEVKQEETKKVKKKKLTNKIIHKHNKNLADYALSDFLSKVKYKSDWYGTKLIEVNQYFPSTKTCSVCGNSLGEMPTDIREIECPHCHTLLQRDLNAAINIKNEAIRINEQENN